MKFLQINLLPEEKKAEARFHLLSRLCIRFFFIGLFIIAITSVSLLPAYFRNTLKGNVVAEELRGEDESVLYKKAISLNQSVTAINREVHIAKNALFMEHPAGQLFIALSTEAPSGIHISHIEFNRANRMITILGKADHRDDILTFVQSLKSQAVVESVDSPLSNLIHSVNVGFTIQIKVKP